MKTNLVLPFVSTLAVTGALFAFPVTSAIIGGALFVAGIVALLARDYALPHRFPDAGGVLATYPLPLAA